VAPKEVTMLDIYRSVLPFVLLQALALAIVMIFPQSVLWLPHLLLR
jgi:TRAP-type mannitol/chloroaromatic compound transport system permease large subunit